MPRGSYGPDDRHLLETAATRVYSNAVAHGSLPADDPRLTEPAVASALCSCSSTSACCATTRRATATTPWTPPPCRHRSSCRSASRARTCSASRPAGLTRSATSAGVPHLPPGDGQPDHRDPRSGEHQQLHRRRRQRLPQKLLTAQPEGRRKASTLAVAEERDIRALERGVRMRTLYQHPARHSPPTREYVADIVPGAPRSAPSTSSSSGSSSSTARSRSSPARRATRWRWRSENAR